MQTEQRLITVRMTAPSQTNVRRIPTDLDYIAGAARVRCGILTCGQYFYQRRCRRQLLFCLSCTAITVHHASPFELVFQSELRDFRTLSPEGAGIPRRLPDLRRLTRGSSVSVWWVRQSGRGQSKPSGHWMINQLKLNQHSGCVENLGVISNSGSANALFIIPMNRTFQGLWRDVVILDYLKYISERVTDLPTEA